MDTPDTPRPERVTLSDAMLAGLHEAGWFARADLDPDHLYGLVHDATDAISEWLAAREQALRNQIAGAIDTEYRKVQGDSGPHSGTYHKGYLYGLDAAQRIAKGETR